MGKTNIKKIDKDTFEVEVTSVRRMSRNKIQADIDRLNKVIDTLEENNGIKTLKKEREELHNILDTK
jgi:hypothetical protein